MLIYLTESHVKANFGKLCSHDIFLSRTLRLHFLRFLGDEVGDAGSYYLLNFLV